jgi:cyclophilin family peptidyl-prolyl cis-trans isomerase
MTPAPRTIEPLESRIAPAIVVANPIFDITASTGQTGASIDLAKMVDVSKTYRTTVEFVTNFTLPGETEPAKIAIELFDDKAPVTVANFLHYLNNKNTAADYDGVFFHRLVQGFVLQGGGFNATDQNTHIATFATVHNEFDANDPERSNIIQTVAMAKVAAEQGGGPHSATSEFFVNLADNSSNLNAQNGGFTVFGRVTDASMSVVSAIANLQLFNDAVPVQNYTSGLPTAAQLITITDAHVVTPVAGNADGTSFTVTPADITDADTGLPTKLITAKLNPETNQLDLKFAPGMTGVAKVKVKLSKAGEADMFDEFEVKVLPNLITDVVTDGLKSTFVPGDKGQAKVRLTNNGGAVAKGKVNVKLYLSESNANGGGDAKGFELDTEGDDADLLLATLNNVNINVLAGKSATIPVNFTVPSTGLTDGKSYRLLAIVESPTGSTVKELFIDDNVGNFRKENTSLTSSEVLRNFDFAFGAVGGRSKVPITVQDADGQNITFVLTGPGTGDVVKNTDGTIDVTLNGTNATSSLRVTAAKGVIADIDDLFISDTIGTVPLSNVHLHGHFTASGGAKSIVFGDLGNTDDAHPENNADKTLSIGVFPVETQKLALTFGKVHDYSLQSDMTISKLSAKEWLNDEVNTGANVIGAQAIGVMKIGGDLEASLNLAGTTKLSQLSVTGAMRGVQLKTGGDVGTVQVGDLIGSSFFVGMTSKPDDLSDFAAGKTIANFTVKGTMSDSVVAAAKINVVSVAAVDANPGSEVGGFYADAIKSYVRKGVVKKTNLDAAAIADTVLPNYQVQVF